MRRGGTTVQNVEHTTLLLIKIEEERNLFVNTKIIAIIGRSGSGKSTLAKELAIDLNANIIKSFTTRDLRDEYDDHTQSTHQQYEIDKNNNKAIAIYEFFNSSFEKLVFLYLLILCAIRTRYAPPGILESRSDAVLSTRI